MKPDLGVESNRAAEGYRNFYEAADPRRHGRDEMPEALEVTSRWIGRCEATQKLGVVLELGCGRGPLGHIHPAYIGLEFSRKALASVPAGVRTVNADMQALPFQTNSIGFVFSWAAIEHVPYPERVLEEVARVLKPGGVALLAPAWNCRPWASKGLPVRRYRDLDWRSRLEKLTIPLRDHLLWRAAWAAPWRVMGELKALANVPLPFKYRRLSPNLTEYVYTDCDAFTSMDPHAAILYFATRGWSILSHPSRSARLLSRYEPVVVKKPH
jgi:SAM-dependent methyltransferase